jgi:hypothetical protein
MLAIGFLSISRHGAEDDSIAKELLPNSRKSCKNSRSRRYSLSKQFVPVDAGFRSMTVDTYMRLMFDVCRERSRVDGDAGPLGRPARLSGREGVIRHVSWFLGALGTSASSISKCTPLPTRQRQPPGSSAPPEGRSHSFVNTLIPRAQPMR